MSRIIHNAIIHYMPHGVVEMMCVATHAACACANHKFYVYKVHGISKIVIILQIHVALCIPFASESRFASSTCLSPLQEIGTCVDVFIGKVNDGTIPMKRRGNTKTVVEQMMQETRQKVVILSQTDRIKVSQGFKGIEWDKYIKQAKELKWDISKAKIEYCRVPGKEGRHKCALIPKDEAGFFDVEVAAIDDVTTQEKLVDQGVPCSLR